MHMKYRTPLMNAATAENVPGPSGASSVPTAQIPSASAPLPPLAPGQGQVQPAPASLPDDMKALIDNPELFKTRLSKEREVATKGLVKELGFEKIEDAKSFFAEAKKDAEAKKTEAQRTAEKIAALEPLTGEVKQYETLVDDLLAVEVDCIPASKKSLLDDLAPSGEKPEQKRARLLWVRKAKASGLFNETAPVAEEKKPPATSRAGSGNPPTPAPPAGEKHPRDMTSEEFKRFEQQKLAEHTARR